MTAERTICPDCGKRGVTLRLKDDAREDNYGCMYCDWYAFSDEHDAPDIREMARWREAQLFADDKKPLALYVVPPLQRSELLSTFYRGSSYTVVMTYRARLYQVRLNTSRNVRDVKSRTARGKLRSVDPLSSVFLPLTLVARHAVKTESED